MLNSTTIAHDQAAADRIADTEKHLRDHGRSLCDLLDALDTPAGLDALCDLHGILDNQQPDARRVEEALSEIGDALASQTAASIAAIGRERKLDAPLAIRWHGARICELRERFRHAR